MTIGRLVWRVIDNSEILDWARSVGADFEIVDDEWILQVDSQNVELSLTPMGDKVYGHITEHGVKHDVYTDNTDVREVAGMGECLCVMAESQEIAVGIEEGQFTAVST